MSHDLTLSRRLNAGPAALWRCWTEAALLKRWFAPRPVETLEAFIHPRPGGRFHTVMRVPGHGDIASEGCILVAEPAHRLVWTNALVKGFQPATPGPGPLGFVFSADVRFTPDGAGCLYDVVLRHATEADRNTHADMGFHDGWTAAATQLEEVAQGL